MPAMPMSFIQFNKIRAALLAAALAAITSPAMAQRSSARRVDAVIVTAPAVRVRTAPSISSLSIDDYGKGSVFAVAPDEYQYKDWIGVMLDGRVVFIPRDAVATRQSAAAPAPAMEPVVSQAGTPVKTAPLAPEPAPMPVMSVTRAEPAAPAVERAPARVASVTTAPPVAVATVAAAPVAAAPTPAAPTTAAPTMVARAAEPRAEPAPQRAPEPAPQVAAPAPARTETPAEKKPEQPAFNARRAGIDVTVGVLASLTPIETAGLPTAAHVDGHTFLGASYHGLGAYVAPEYGQGGGYRSTMLVGGLSLNLINLHALRITALGGYGQYSETTMPSDSTTAPVTRSLNVTSVGGMVSIPFIGPIRLAYRGQYIMGQYLGTSTQMRRHSVGFVF